jgi:hypothetical protein
MYQVAAFRNWFARRGYKNSTYNTHNSFLNRIDELVGGLDEKINAEGIDAILKWAKGADGGPFEKYASQSRSVLNRYVEFLIDAQSPTNALDEESDLEEASDPAIFHVEREMQSAVRKQLELLESGLREADGGLEVSVATGRIDILAEDRNGNLVVIELKAGLCPSGAIEQVLGYAEALFADRGKPVRAYLIASEFSDRHLAAAKRVRDLELRTYEFSLKFHLP